MKNELKPKRYEFSYRNDFNDTYPADRDDDADGRYVLLEDVQEAIAAWNRRPAPAQGALPDVLPELPPRVSAEQWKALYEAAMLLIESGKQTEALRERLALVAQQYTVSDACTWTLTDDDSNVWESSCGEAWTFIDGGPKENSIRHCHGCGKLVAAIQAQVGDATGGAA